MPYQQSRKLHIVAVNAAIRRDDGRYLVLKRSEKETAFPGYWCFPGGKIEGNDTVAHTLANEVREETGLELKSVGLLVRDTAFERPDGQTVKVFTYLCCVAGGDVVLEENGFTDFRWILPKELEHMQHTNLNLDIEAAERLINRRE